MVDERRQYLLSAGLSAVKPVALPAEVTWNR